MKSIEKTYNINDSEIKVTITQGFDQELITNHPKDFDKNPHILYMFLTKEELSQNSDWLWSNKEQNNFINITLTEIEDFDIIVNNVEKIFNTIIE
jgi:hypothetical protein